MRNCVYILVACSSIFFVMQTTYATLNVRVLIDQGDLKEQREWQIGTPKKNFICNYTGTTLVCNGKALGTTALRVHTAADRCTYRDSVYAGDIILVVRDTRWYVINSVPLEEYVYSVLRSESWPGWPLEVNKVFAIMIRTYGLHKIMVSGKMKQKPLFDIRSTNIHQTYKGIHDSDILRQAVTQTAHTIVSYDKQPIVAMYDSCCGGVTPAHLSGFDFKATPYLARTYPCTYCTECKLYRWKIIYPHDLLRTLLHTEFPGLKQIKDLRTVRVDHAGKVIELDLRSSRNHKKITGRQLYRLCKDIKSFCYTVTKQGNTFVFEGKGFGHHVGVCQWGVRTMVKDGFGYRTILSYYYPGTALMKLRTVPLNDLSHASA